MLGHVLPIVMRRFLVLDCTPNALSSGQPQASYRCVFDPHHGSSDVSTTRVFFGNGIAGDLCR